MCLCQTKEIKMEYTTRTAKNDQELMTAKWHKACADWKPSSNGSAEGFPQLSMYGFHRNYGYVTRGEHGACWRKTKAESIEAFKKMYRLV